MTATTIYCTSCGHDQEMEWGREEHEQTCEVCGSMTMNQQIGEPMNQHVGKEPRTINQIAAEARTVCFEDNPTEYKRIRKQIQRHYNKGEISKGTYGDELEAGKWNCCLIGAILHSDEHQEMETKYGIPIEIAKMADKIFEALPDELAIEFPLQFWDSITPGTDLSVAATAAAHRLRNAATIDVPAVEDRDTLLELLSNAKPPTISTYFDRNFLFSARWFDERTAT